MIASTSLINFGNMNPQNIDVFLNLLKGQNIPELTLVIYADSDFLDGQPNPATVAAAKNIISSAKTLNITINVDIHPWYTTWDKYFRKNPSSSNKRAEYLTYVKNMIDAFNGYPVSAWMVLNEPQARTAVAEENQFILDVIAAAKTKTTQPVSVRFMGGYSPSTGHYAEEIDNQTDYMCRNVYWDPRTPNVVKYGVSKMTMDKMVSQADAFGRELWVTEFGKVKSDLTEQQAYVKAFVEYGKSKDIGKLFCWAAQPSAAGENYNIFNGYNPLPAFGELVNTPPNPCQPYIDQIAALNATVNNQLDTIQILDDRVAELESEVSLLKSKMNSAQLILTY